MVKRPSRHWVRDLLYPPVAPVAAFGTLVILTAHKWAPFLFSG